MFKPLLLTTKNETVFLTGQLKRGYFYAVLPAQIGLCKYIITVYSGVLQLNHMAYNHDGGTWTCYPRNKQYPHRDLEQGQTYEIVINVFENFKMLAINEQI